MVRLDSCTALATRRFFEDGHAAAFNRITCEPHCVVQFPYVPTTSGRHAFYAVHALTRPTESRPCPRLSTMLSTKKRRRPRKVLRVTSPRPRQSCFETISQAPDSRRLVFFFFWYKLRLSTIHLFVRRTNTLVCSLAWYLTVRQSPTCTSSHRAHCTRFRMFSLGCWCSRQQSRLEECYRSRVTSGLLAHTKRSCKRLRGTHSSQGTVHDAKWFWRCRRARVRDTLLYCYSLLLLYSLSACCCARNTSPWASCLVGTYVTFSVVLKVARCSCTAIWRIQFRLCSHLTRRLATDPTLVPLGTRVLCALKLFRKPLARC